jgi:hypothetical protein
MSFSRRHLERLIDEIRQEDVSLDELDAATLKRWHDDEQATDALKDILARAENTNGTIKVSDVVAFIQLVLAIKFYAAKTDRSSAKTVKFHREIKRLLPRAQSLLARAFRKGCISPEDAAKRMTDLKQINVDSPQPPIRSSKSGSRIRTLFMRELSAAGAPGWIPKLRQSPAWFSNAKSIASTCETLAEDSVPQLVVHSFQILNSSPP